MLLEDGYVAGYWLDDDSLARCVKCTATEV